MPVISVCMPSDTDFLVSFRMPLRGVMTALLPLRLVSTMAIHEITGFGPEDWNAFTTRLVGEEWRLLPQYGSLAWVGVMCRNALCVPGCAL